MTHFLKLLSVPLLGLLLACGSAAGSGPCAAALPPDVSPRAACPTETIAASGRSFAPGAPIPVTVVAVNSTSSPCAGAQDLICGGPALSLLDAGGKPAWTRTRPQVACPMLIRLLQPGETQDYQITIAPPALPAGVYALAASPGSNSDFGRYYLTIC